MSDANTGTVDASSSQETGTADQVGQPEAQVTEGGAEPKDQKQAVAALKEKFKLTVDGEEFEEEVDWNNKEDIKRRLQLAHAAKKRMAEAKAEKAKAFDIVKAFEEDPGNILRRLGPKGREAAEKYLLEHIQESMLTPEQKAQAAKDAKLKKYEEQEELTAKQQAEQAMQAKQNQYAQEFQTTIIQALEKSGLPKSPANVKRMANIMANNLKLGLNLSPDDLVIEVKTEVQELLKSIMKDSDGDQLVSMFGEDIANKIRKSDIRKLQEKHGQVFQNTQPKSQVSQPKAEEDRPLSMEEWKEQISRRVNS